MIIDMQIRFLYIVFIIMFMNACGLPGLQKLRTSESDGEGSIIPDCYNLSATPKIENYVTDSYLTTWGSAALEGAANGVESGLENQGSVEGAILSAMSGPNVGENGENIFNDLFVGIKPYCRAFAASRREVSVAVSMIVPHLGNPIRISDVERGIFQTALTDRKHRIVDDERSLFPKMGARWKDAYVIAVTEERTNRTIVKILRLVYISRVENILEDGTKHWSSYHQARSSGQNESWILGQVSDIVRNHN